MTAAYTVDGAAASSEAFYRAACDPARSVVVEACAGAGKTWMLVSRIVRALLEGAEPQQILAITFTRKAAGEMRTRLDEWLHQWASPSFTDRERERALVERGLSVAEARPLVPVLAGLQRRVLASGRAVEVRTFHSWFVQLIGAAPLELRYRLGLPPNLSWIEDTEVLRPALFRSFHARVAADAELRADHAALVRRHRRTKVQAWLDVAWSRAAEWRAADAADGVETAVATAAQCFPECEGLAEPAAWLFNSRNRRPLLALARALGVCDQKSAQEAGTRLVDALAMTDASAALGLAWQALFTTTGEARKLPPVEGLEDGRVLLLRVRDAVLQQHAHEDHRRMLRLARVLDEEYTAVKRRQSLVDMADLEQAAHALLSDAVLAGWVHERLDTRLRAVLIDEFQDTNPLQWQALQSWFAGYAGAGGGSSGQRPPSVFIVGDPKQSIYRFRRAEPRVFAAAQEFVVQALGGQRLACDHTRRNAREVLAAVNAVFGQAVRDGAWSGFREHTTASTDRGEVVALPAVPRAAAPAQLPSQAWRPSLTVPRREPERRHRLQELQQVASGVTELLATPGWKPGEVMVLARRRAVLAELSELLAAQGVPHVMPEDLAVAELPEALDVIALLDVLASPGHDLSLARALKSPLFGASDSDLLWLSQRARAAAVPWLAALLAAEEAPSPELRRAGLLLRRWAEQGRARSPHDLLDLVVAEGEIRQRLVAVAPPARERVASQAVDALLGAAITQQGGRFATLYAFVRSLKSGQLKVPASPPGEAVQLLTVHGAKGLQARAVFVTDADPGGAPRELAAVFVDWPPEQAAPRSAAFYLPGASLPPSLRAAHAEELRQVAREELNALYVAMTRASERLVFSHTEPRATPGDPTWWRRVAGHTRPWRPAVPLAAATTPQALVPMLPVLSPARQRPAKTAAPAADGSANLGRAIHRALEWVGRQHLAGQPERWADVAGSAAEAFALPANTSEHVLAAMRAVLQGPDSRHFFADDALQWAGDEVTLAWQGQVLRADRVVQLAGDEGWWVLDYKLSSRPEQVEAYREQLQTYRAALQALTPGQPVRAAFITAGGALREV